jgi:hypothetical protein
MLSLIKRAAFPRLFSSHIEKKVLSSRLFLASQPPKIVQPLLDKVAQDLFFTEIIRTMWLVLEQMFKPPYTIMY